jgi:hypothetical protein
MENKDCSTCDNAGWDPDGNYCAASKLLKKHPHGLNIGPIPNGVEGYCEKPSYVLYEKKK